MQMIGNCGKWIVLHTYPLILLIHSKDLRAGATAQTLRIHNSGCARCMLPKSAK